MVDSSSPTRHPTNASVGPAPESVRWVATADEGALLEWATDRSTSAGRHLAPVVAAGRLGDGRLAVDVLRPGGTPIGAALDVLGTPTTGVAVTLTVPLLELAAAGRGGAVAIGTASLDDVLVDDAGAVLLCDRPPGAIPDRLEIASAATGVTASGASSRTDRKRATSPAPSLPDQDGARVLLLAARLVWERVDPHDPARPPVDAALADALDGDVAAVRTALDRVTATAAPRPVRWCVPTDDVIVGVPRPVPVDTGSRSVVGVARDIVERGIPIGGGRRLPLRRALVGVVVAAGCSAAAVFALGG